jgi:hypothetical protein
LGWAGVRVWMRKQERGCELAVDRVMHHDASSSSHASSSNIISIRMLQALRASILLCRHRHLLNSSAFACVPTLVCQRRPKRHRQTDRQNETETEGHTACVYVNVCLCVRVGGTDLHVRWGQVIGREEVGKGVDEHCYCSLPLFTHTPPHANHKHKNKSVSAFVE